VRIVILHGPQGRPLAVNADEWHTVLPSDGSIKGANTMIGFAGAGSQVAVQETFDEVLKLLSEPPTS
jgi:hypothetical protein